MALRPVRPYSVPFPWSRSFLCPGCVGTRRCGAGRGPTDPSPRPPPPVSWPVPELHVRACPRSSNPHNPTGGTVHLSYDLLRPGSRASTFSCLHICSRLCYQGAPDSLCATCWDPHWRTASRAGSGLVRVARAVEADLSGDVRCAVGGPVEGYNRGLASFWRCPVSVRSTRVPSPSARRKRLRENAQGRRTCPATRPSFTASHCDSRPSRAPSLRHSAGGVASQ